MSNRFIFVVATESSAHHLGHIPRDAVERKLREVNRLDASLMRRRMISLRPRLYGAIRLLSLSEDREERAEVDAFLAAEAPEIMVFAMVLHHAVERLSDWGGDGACLTVQKDPFKPEELECLVQPVFADPEKVWRFNP